MADPDVAALFLKFSREKLLEYDWPRLRACVESLTDEQVWWRPNPSSNSIGNLVLHLTGNVRQWLVASFEQLADDRDRPREFSERQPASRTELLERLDATLQQGAKVLSRLTETDLRATFHIQGYTVTGLHAVYQVVEHFGQHYAQIAYITKILQDRDLGFYRALDKTGRA